MITSSDTMIEFFFTILEHVCPLFVQIAQMSLILPRRGLILPRKPPATPVLYSASKPLLGICTYTKHPKTPPQNTPFPCLKLKVGKTNYCLGKMDPNWAKILKSGKTFLEMGKKNYSFPCRRWLRSSNLALAVVVDETGAAGASLAATWSPILE